LLFFASSGAIILMLQTVLLLHRTAGAYTAIFCLDAGTYSRFLETKGKAFLAIEIGWTLGTDARFLIFGLGFNYSSTIYSIIHGHGEMDFNLVSTPTLYLEKVGVKENVGKW
jgi:hypothetical protein